VVCVRVCARARARCGGVRVRACACVRARACVRACACVCVRTCLVISLFEKLFAAIDRLLRVLVPGARVLALELRAQRAQRLKVRRPGARLVARDGYLFERPTAQIPAAPYGRLHLVQVGRVLVIGERHTLDDWQLLDQLKLARELHQPVVHSHHHETNDLVVLTTIMNAGASAAQPAIKNNC
jgi:hypothetical protein